MIVLSVIIPVLEEEKILETTLSRWKSASETWPFETEFIISDGGSTDNTCLIASQWADEVVSHRESRRQTISEGRNKGAERASGEYLLFTNADVRLPADSSTFISKLMQLARDRGAATSRVKIHKDQRLLRDSIVLGTCDFIFMSMNKMGIGMGRGECHLIKRELFDSLGGYREDLIAGEDFEFFKRVAQTLKRSGQKIGYLWDDALYEDPRRYRELGYTKTMYNWFANTLAVTLFNKSYSKEWSVLR